MSELDNYKVLHLAYEGLLAIWLRAAQVVQAALGHMQATQLLQAVPAVCVAAPSWPHKAASREILHADATCVVSLQVASFNVHDDNGSKI